MKTAKKKYSDRQLLSSLPLLRLEKDYLDAAKRREHGNAKKIIKQFHDQFFPQLSVLGRRKLSTRLAKITELLNKKKDLFKMVDNTIDHVHRTWDIIEYTCQICGIISNNKFPKVYPCKHDTICSKCQNGRLYCVTCNTPIDYEMTSKLRTSNNRQHERELLEKAAEDEREKANKLLRMNALRERRKQALAGVKLEQQFQQQKRQLEADKEQEDRMIVQAKARALRDGKSFKNVEEKSKKSRQKRTSYL